MVYNVSSTFVATINVKLNQSIPLACHLSIAFIHLSDKLNITKRRNTEEKSSFFKLKAQKQQANENYSIS